jgi:hypothetical protein
MKRRETQSKTEILQALKASGRALSHDMIQDSLTGFAKMAKSTK